MKPSKMMGSPHPQQQQQHIYANKAPRTAGTHPPASTNLDPLKDLEHEVAVVDVVEGLVGLVDDVVEVAVQQLHDDVELVLVLVH